MTPTGAAVTVVLACAAGWGVYRVMGWLTDRLIGGIVVLADTDD